MSYLDDFEFFGNVHKAQNFVDDVKSGNFLF